jgi:hypothetical protein
MDQNWFFRWVWRFNALALSVVLIAAAIGLALPFLAWQVSPVVDSVVQTEPASPAAKPPKYRWHLDYPRGDRKVGVLALILAPENAEILDASSLKPPSPIKTVNYLFVDPQTGATRWLFPTHNQLITSTDYMALQGAVGDFAIQPSGTPIAVVYDVIPGDPNAAPIGRKVDVYASKIDGTNLTKFMGDLDEAPTFVPAGEGVIIANGKANDKDFVATFSLTEFKQLARKDLDALTPK